ncbi:hypothetical protein VPBG_00028 [Vibrio phage helene 12B3]|nr:hypothetical protein VPBG_00028 [Vibrio phage helene 12B3]AGG57800.1 hypothetical protein VPBG_00028 [Vibrio phage helene 12B3]
MSKELTYEMDEHGVFIEDEAHEAAMDNLIGLLMEGGVLDEMEDFDYD